MSKNYSDYLEFLAAEYNILYIGKESIEEYNHISSYFMSSVKRNMKQTELDNIAFTLSKHDVNIVILDTQGVDKLVEDFYKAIRAYNDDISIMLMYNHKNYKEFCEIVPFVDIALNSPVDSNVFYKKLFTLISTSYTIKSIGRRDIVLKRDNVNEESIDKFFDIYEGSSLFIADELTEIVDSLESGLLSEELFSLISKKMLEIKDIFEQNPHTNSVSPIFNELSEYLNQLDFSTIEPENLVAFNYLSDIISDISIYLMDMFVDRIYKDVYVFEHSLKSNIEFMKAKLSGDENDSEVDFF